MIIDNIVKNACGKSCHCFLKFFPNLASVKNILLFLILKLLPVILATISGNLIHCENF